MLNGRQIHTKIDTLSPSPAHTAQGKQAKEATKSQQSERQLPVTQVAVMYKVGDPCYAHTLDHDTIVILDGCPPLLSNVLEPTVSTCVWFRGPVWRRHIDQLQRRYVLPDDTEPGDTPRLSESREENPSVSEQLPSDTSTATTGQLPTPQNVSLEDGPRHPRRSKRLRKPCCC